MICHPAAVRAPTSPVAAVARLAAWCLAVSLVISRAGLLVHELVGHGGAAYAVGGAVTDLHVYLFAGGWIEYGGSARWSPTALAVVSLAGIAVELAVAGALAAWARRTDALALRAAAWALAIHAAPVPGDRHRRRRRRRQSGCIRTLGACARRGGRDPGRRSRWPRSPPRWPPRRLGAALLAPGCRRTAARHQRAQLVLALALAGGAHAALVVGELRLRPDPVYARVMATEQRRVVERELAAWRAAHPTVDDAALRAARAAIAARHPARRWAPWIVVAVAAAVVLGLAGARARAAPAAPAPLAPAVIAALAAVVTVGTIDALVRGFW
jgi:hypothetical protein